MEITRRAPASVAGPADWFTGTVFLDHLVAPGPESAVQAVVVHFSPGARTAWHVHPHGQTIVITEGRGLCQRRGGPVEALAPGDRVFFAPDEEHWHGATPEHFMTHLAVAQADVAGTTVVWGPHVDDDEYQRPPR